ncbi:DUF192 domain-containing protein [Candidatus Peregrinibacteria bacterium]|nr:DUF192 domain-containing protein [Candidatus Peregrinibacteria bacterium]
MKFTRKFLVVALLMVNLVLAGCFFGGNKETPKNIGPAVSFNAAKGHFYFAVDIADTLEERKKGLMWKKSMGKYNGMLFIFEGEEARRFWMKNTLIPLDMIFMDKDYRVVSVIKQAQPCRKDPCESMSSGKPAKFVLEVNGGMADEMGLKEGDTAQLTL